MLPCLILLLLAGLPACSGTEGEEVVLKEETVPWLTLTLEEGPVPRIHFRIREVKSDSERRFIALMGKQARGKPPVLPQRTEHQQGQVVKGLLSSQGPSPEELSPGREAEDQGSE